MRGEVVVRASVQGGDVVPVPLKDVGRERDERAGLQHARVPDELLAMFLAYRRRV